MPAFSAIGAYVAGSLLGLTGAAATIAGIGLSWAGIAVASVVAIGASYITSRIIGGSQSSGGGAGDTGSQGGRIQLPPASDNKIPVLYGRGFINGTLIDARLLSTDQKTNNVMYYAMVLSETCNVAGATYTVNNVYWNDLRLIAETTSGNQHKILKGVKKVDGPGEDFEDTNFKKDSNHRVQMRIYAGNSTAAQQIWPLQSTGNTQAAWDFWPDSNWDSTYRMEGLVLAVIRLEYDQENGFTNLPQVTFDITNSADNPAIVWQDYMTSGRYGAGLSSSDLNTAAVTEWRDFCDEMIRYTDVSSTSTTQKRYTINGPIDTNRSVKDNIDSILRNGGAWMSYDVTDAKWRPIIKKAITAGDPADAATHFTATCSGYTLTVSAFPEGRLEPGQEIVGAGIAAGTTIVEQILPLTTGESTGQKGRYTLSTTQTVSSGTPMYALATGLLSFDDDNILSGITISSTRLDDLYNAYDVEFFDKYNKDQKAYARDELPSGARNTQEPDNTLSFSLDLCNNSVQADLIGNMELRQSRDDLVIEFTASHYGIQAQAGDIIEVTNNIYGWAPKLFRVMRIKESEGEDGQLVANISALEYNGDVYTVESIGEFTTEANIGIAPQVSSYNLVTPNDDGVVVTDVNTNVAVPNIVIAVEIPTTGGPYDEIQIWYAADSTSVFPSSNEYRWLQSTKPPGNDPIFKNARTIQVNSISSNVLTSPVAHNLQAGDTLLFKLADTNGLLLNRMYYVLDDGLTSTQFKVSLSQNGNAVTLTNWSGTAVNAFNTCYGITIITLPSNISGQQYYFKTRVGLRGYYSGFTNPDTAVIPAAEFIPNPVGGGSLNDLSDVIISSPLMGDLLYYNGVAWINDNVIASTAAGQRLTIEYQDDATGIDSSLFLRKDYTTSTYTDGDGTSIGFQIDSDTQDQEQYGLVGFTWDTTNPQFGVFASTDNFATTQTLFLSNNNRTNFHSGLLYLDNANNRIGINDASPSYELDVNGSAQITGGLIVDTNTLVVDATNNRVGIKNASPTVELDITGQVIATSGGRFNYVSVGYGGTTETSAEITTIGGRDLYLDSDTNIIKVFNTGDSADFNIYGRAYVENDFLVHGSTTLGNSNIVDTTSVIGELQVNTDQLFVDGHNTGYVGIQRNDPAFPLDVDGDVRFTGDLQLDGHDIKASNGTTCITIATNGDVLINNDLAVGGDVVRLNYDQLGISPSSNAHLWVERGTSSDVELLWDETADRWKYTFNGTDYYVMPNQNLDTTDTPTFAGMTLGNIRVGVTDDNTIDTASGNLVLDSATNEIVINANTTTNGTATITSTLNVDSGTLYVDAVNNRVGINDTTPSYSLDVNGDANITSNTTIGGNLIVDTDTLYVNATTERVGINNSSPTQALDVVGNIIATGDIEAGATMKADTGFYTDGYLQMYGDGYSAGTYHQTINYEVLGTSDQVVDQFSSNQWRSAHYKISISKGTDYQTMDIMVLHDGTTSAVASNVVMNVSGELTLGTAIGTFSVVATTISLVDYIQLKFDPVDFGTGEMIIHKILFGYTQP